MTNWKRTTETPGDGDSIWVAVLEWDGKNTHVDYAVTYLDVDGLRIKRSEEREEEAWPPQEVLAWMPCEMPDYEHRCPFCNTLIGDLLDNPCCAEAIAVRDDVRRKFKPESGLEGS